MGYYLELKDGDTEEHNVRNMEYYVSHDMIIWYDPLKRQKKRDSYVNGTQRE